MGRDKVKSRKRGAHTEDDMKKAMELVHAGMSIRKASKECNLRYPTVRLYVKRLNENPGESIRLTPNYEVNRIFTLEEEETLVKYIEYCAQLFYGLTVKDCRRVAYQMAKINNKKIPQSWIDAEMAGFEWLRSFRKRHPEISLRKPEACSLARATAFNRHNIESFYRNLKVAMERHPSFGDGSRIYNLDETATTTVQRPGKVLARKGTNVAKVTSGERGTLVTTCCIVSAMGQALPPAMVFPRKVFKPHMLYGAPPGTLGLAAASGWMNTELFLEVMQHFIKHVSASKDNPALLIMDNHESHLSIEALDLAKASGVTILTLHPHTTAKLQPLDVGLNAPFKTYYNAAVDSWLLRNPGRPLTIYNIAECAGPAYQKAMTPVNITHAFKKCGIFPYDDSIFTEADFLPSTITDRPDINPISERENIAQETGSQEINETSPMATLFTNQSNDLPPLVNAPSSSHTAGIAKSNEATAINNSSMQPAPSAVPSQNANLTPTSSNFIPPMQFMPPMKAKPRNLKRRRVPGKSMIATDTPEKNAIAEKKKNKKIPITKGKQNLFTGQKMPKKKNIIIENETSDEEDFVASGSSSGGEGFLTGDEEEESDVILDGNFAPLRRDPRQDEYVIVLFPYKKNSVFYVAKILEVIDDNDDDSDFFVSYLRLKNRTLQTFSEPVIPDTAGVQIKDVKYILPDPIITGSSRRQACFKFAVQFNMSNLR